VSLVYGKDGYMNAPGFSVYTYIACVFQCNITDEKGGTTTLHFLLSLPNICTVLQLAAFSDTVNMELSLLRNFVRCVPN
jgi:hypothetical protein